MGNVIGYSEPGSVRGGVSWVSRVAGGIENSSRNVAMGFRQLVRWDARDNRVEAADLLGLE